MMNSLLPFFGHLEFRGAKSVADIFKPRKDWPFLRQAAPSLINALKLQTQALALDFRLCRKWTSGISQGGLSEAGYLQAYKLRCGVSHISRNKEKLRIPYTLV